ncbi:MAG: sulfatase [Draconibacterium sp.]
MNFRSKILLFFITMLVNTVFVSQVLANQNSSKPNVVIVVIDDMGWEQLGCYGSSFYKSPNIDKLAESGVRFTNAYASAPVCSPTRAALMTGKYPARLHLTDFIPGSDPQDKTLLTPEWQKFLPLEEVTIAEILKAEGYKTAIFGKWHLSKEKYGSGSLSNNPDKQGFDETFITLKPSKGAPLGAWQEPEIDGHSTDTIMNRSIEFIQQNRNNPFLLVTSFNAIHDPLMEKASSIEKYAKDADSKLPVNNPVLGAMIERVDNAMGRLISSLEKDKLMENTLLIVFSDNGGLVKSASQSPLREGKGWVYEGGIRVPMMISWKGKINAGRESEQPVATIDILPTVLDLLHVQNKMSTVDGVSLSPVLLNDSPLNRKALFWNYPHYHNGPPSAVIRKGDYKLIELYDKSLTNQPDAFELYDLKNDLGETRNLAAQYPDVVNELKKELSDWKKEVGAQIPELNTKPRK